MKKTLFLLSLLAFSPAALAAVPSGYTEHVITDASLLEPWVNYDYRAFIINGDVINREHRATGEHQYWGELQTRWAHALTFDGLSGTPYGGAVRADDALTMERLKGLSFTGNSAVTGGAVYGKGALTVTNNESVTFSGNTASLEGGAIDGVSASISLTNNGALEFTGNSATSDGGAIASSGALCIAGNGSVTFRNNYEKDDNTYRLRSVFVKGGSLNLAAGDGQDITFYDTLYVKSGATVSFNNSYTDANGYTQQATGDIVFSGKNAEHDLQALKSTFTDLELENSLTTEVNATTNLYGGTLRIEDGAVYKGNGINLAENSGAALRLADGSLRQDGCSVSMAAGTTLTLHGTNSITANSLDMQDGSTLSFVLGGVNAEIAALTLDGAFNQGGTLHISLQAGETFQARNRLILMTTASGATPDSWDASKITFTGLGTDAGSRLAWENGVLYYNARLTWSGESSMSWNNSDENWTLGEYRCGNTDGADVLFGDTGSGDVIIGSALAPKSVLVENTPGHTYFFNGNGNLTGAMQLTKDGEGKLFIYTANDYTGGTVIKGGTLQMLNENALGSEDVTLMGGTLNLGGHTLSNNVNVNGSAHITNGTVSGNFSLADNVSFTWSDADELQLAGSISLGNNTTFDLGGHTLSNNVNVNGSAHIANGTVSGNLNLADNASFTWSDADELQLAGSISLGNNTTFDLGGHTLSNNVNVNGSAHITNGTVSGNLNLADNASFTWEEGSFLELTGSITLGNKTTLDLGKHTLPENVILNGYDTYIGNGSINHDLAVEGGRLYLTGDIDGTGNIILGSGAKLRLAGYTLSNNVVLNGNDAVIDASVGTLSGDLILADNASFTWANCESLQFTGSVTLGNEASLNLGGNTLSNNVNVTGSRAYIGGGSFSGELTVGTDKKLSLCGNLSGNGTIILGESATLDLGKHTLSQNVILNGYETSIGNGSINNDLTVAGQKLTLAGYVDGTGNIILVDDAKLRLADYTLSNKVVLKGPAIIGGGTLDSELTVGEYQHLIIETYLKGKGNIILGDFSTLVLANGTLSNNVILNEDARISGRGTISGDLILADNTSFFWSGVFLDDGVQLTGNIALGERTVLDLRGHAISNNIILNGSYAHISNGTVSGDLILAYYATFTLSNATNLQLSGSISLGTGAELDLGKRAISNDIILNGGYACIGNGSINKDLDVKEGQTLILSGDIDGPGNIILESSSLLELWDIDISNSVILNGGAQITGSGTISGDIFLADNTSFLWSSVFLNDGVQLTGNITLGERTVLDLGSKTLSGSIKLGRRSGIRAWLGSSTTNIQAIQARGLLEKVSVSDGLIAGTDRQTSLADGLYIESDADLMIKSMTITANNEIHVGDNTITLNQVTIDLSKAEYKLVGSDYYFQLQDLINCKLEMDDVVFDASGLELPEGFDPAVNGIGMDFGTDVTIDPQTARNLTLLMGGDWSQTMNLVDGKPVFTALVPTPEPTTGTLSLLGLGLLAARRRRK